MKKVFYLFVMLLALSCSNGKPSQEEINKAKEALKFDAEFTNKQLSGKWVDDMTLLNSCEFDGQNYVFNEEIDEGYITIDAMREQQETITTNAKAMLENNPQFASCKENLKKIGGKVVYNYVGSASKKVLTITIEF